MSLASKNDEDNRGLNKITKQALSQLERDPKQVRNLPPSKQFSETQSGIKSLVIQKRIQTHQANIFGKQAEPETDLTKNLAYQEAFKRYLKDMEQEAIRDKRISMEEYARLNSYDTTARYKDDQKRLMRSNFRQQVLSQWEAKKRSEHDELEEFRTRPHIQGSQGYPFLPQLSAEQQLNIKKNNQQLIKRELIHQMKEKEKLDNIFKEEFAKTTNQYYSKRFNYLRGDGKKSSMSKSTIRPLDSAQALWEQGLKSSRNNDIQEEVRSRIHLNFTQKQVPGQL